MATEPSPLGRLLKDYLFFLDKKETDLAEAIGLSPNKVSAAIHGRYRLQRDHVERAMSAVAAWGLHLTDEAHDELLLAWRSSVKPPQPEPQASRAKLSAPRRLRVLPFRGLRIGPKRRTWQDPPKSGRFGEDPRLLPRLVKEAPRGDSGVRLDRVARAPHRERDIEWYRHQRLLRELK